MILSIVIPTKNRLSTLLPSLESILAVPWQNFEVVVTDNSDAGLSLLEMEGIPDDPRLKYHRIDRPVNMVENCDLAISFACGDYVMMLGDDDSVAPTIESVSNWMLNENIDMVSCSKIVFLWPGVSGKIDEDGNEVGLCKMPHFTFETTELDTVAEFERVLKLGGTDIAGLPCVYHGIIKRSLLLSVKEISGSVFPGPSPDMANAIALSQVGGRHYFIDGPLAISGNSSSSGAGLGLRKAHHGELINNKSLPDDTIDNWREMVPKFWSSPTIWSASLVRALERMCATSDISRINLPYLYAYCLVFHYQYFDRILISYKKMGKVGNLFALAKGFAAVLALRAKAFLINRRLLANSTAQETQLLVAGLKETQHAVRDSCKMLEEKLSISR